MDRAGIPVATRDQPLGRFFWEVDYERTNPPHVSDKHGRTFYFPFANYAAPHAAQSQKEKAIAAALVPMTKKASQTGGPAFLFFGSIPKKVLTERISYSEPDGTMRLGVAIIVNPAVDLSMAEWRSAGDHDIGHFPQIWTMPRETFRIADQIFDKLIGRRFAPASSIGFRIKSRNSLGCLARNSGDRWPKQEAHQTRWRA